MAGTKTLLANEPTESANLPKPAGELPGIQMLRAAAALLVVLHHVCEQSNAARNAFSPDWFTTLGAAGVDIFFVISGFIMLYVSFNRPVPIRTEEFLIRRIKRIYPFYWICCLAMLTVYAVGFLKHNPLSSYDVIASFLLLPSNAKLINVSWTLVFEMYFYAIFAVTLLFRSARATVTMATVVILALTFCGTIWRQEAIGAFLSNPIPLEFCMGLLLGWAFITQTKRGRAWPAWSTFGFIGFGLLALSSYLVPHTDTHGLPGIYRVFAWGIPAALVVAAALNIGAPKMRVTRFVVLLGDASYALYLTHEFVMIGYGWLIKKTMIGRVDQIFITPLVVCASVIVGVLAHRLVERPLMQAMRNPRMPPKTVNAAAE